MNLSLLLLALAQPLSAVPMVLPFATAPQAIVAKMAPSAAVETRHGEQEALLRAPAPKSATIGKVAAAKVAPKDQVWVSGPGDKRVVLSDVSQAGSAARIFLASSAALQSGLSKTKLVKEDGDTNKELRSYDAEIRAAAKKHRLPEQLIRAVVRVESNFDPNARSHAGARGLMQIMPHVWPSLGVKDPTNPAQCVEGGAKLLREYADRYDGDIVKALAAYNAGPRNVDKKGGIPFAQTGKYVHDVLHHFSRYSAASMSVAGR